MPIRSGLLLCLLTASSVIPAAATVAVADKTVILLWAVPAVLMRVTVRAVRPEGFQALAHDLSEGDQHEVHAHLITQASMNSTAQSCSDCERHCPQDRNARPRNAACCLKNGKCLTMPKSSCGAENFCPSVWFAEKKARAAEVRAARAKAAEEAQHVQETVQAIQSTCPDCCRLPGRGSPDFHMPLQDAVDRLRSKAALSKIFAAFMCLFKSNNQIKPDYPANMVVYVTADITAGAGSKNSRELQDAMAIFVSDQLRFKTSSHAAGTPERDDEIKNDLRRVIESIAWWANPWKPAEAKVPRGVWELIRDMKAAVGANRAVDETWADLSDLLDEVDEDDLFSDNFMVRYPLPRV
eukprot:TRINITY_DN18632_c0_g1_i1.p1 TRINITY_DN18632_c0_g1~~TRINITY_DN18632_c0_g1_i1.p1  ORF type:complete len:353 (-),score=59.08 TRINITY_DN18632_c0_g1_i1:133-1191(-)